MKTEWLNYAKELSFAHTDMWMGRRKLFRHVVRRFEDFGDPIELADVGYSAVKLKALEKAYVHEPSLKVAVPMWARRTQSGKAGSVGFSCYNHILKPWSKLDMKGIGSLMGPCLQSVIITQTPKRQAEVDVFYRTTEFFKKFAADLVMIRELMLSRFDFSRTPLMGITCHFVNVTISPTYIGVLIEHLDAPCDFLDELSERDPKFYEAVARWLNQLLAPEVDIELEKFNQSKRVGRHLRKAIPTSTQKDVIEFLRDRDPTLIDRLKLGTISEDDDD